MSAKVVIGANFGDEGKGVMTDYLVHDQQSSLVIRFNGGAQAGHTVTTPDGKRHVFSHFGSGAFAGAATLLSRFFIVNPMLFIREWKELEAKNPSSMKVLIDRNAPVTTPYDMLLNQMAEEKRTSRHGSCGLGIGETIERNEKFFDLTVTSLLDIDKLRIHLLNIRDYWVPIRKKALGLGDSRDDVFKSDKLLEDYLQVVEFMLRNSTIVDDSVEISKAKNPVFEGAQGLLLDQNHVYFPHVTRSNTGIKNALVLAGSAGISELDVYYMTRTYLTRHGAGPLSNELSHVPIEGIEDKTNVPNPWQGTLRYAYLDIDLLKRTIREDLMTNHTSIKVKPKLGITWVDAVGDSLPVFVNGKEQTLSETYEADIADQISKLVGMNGNHLKSYGPTRQSMIDFMRAEDYKIEQAILEEQREKYKTAAAKKKKQPAVV